MNNPLTTEKELEIQFWLAFDKMTDSELLLFLKRIDALQADLSQIPTNDDQIAGIFKKRLQDNLASLRSIAQNTYLDMTAGKAVRDYEKWWNDRQGDE